MSLLLSAVLTAVGYFMMPADIKSIAVQFAAGFVIGTIVSTIVPVGEIGAAVASKFSAPGSPAFSFFMFNVILLIMLVFMCPLIKHCRTLVTLVVSKAVYLQYL